MHDRKYSTTSVQQNRQIRSTPSSINGGRDQKKFIRYFPELVSEAIQLGGSEYL